MDREQTTLRISPELKEELQKEAAQNGMSFNSLVLWLIDKGRQCQQQ